MKNITTLTKHLLKLFAPFIPFVLGIFILSGIGLWAHTHYRASYDTAQATFENIHQSIEQNFSAALTTLTKLNATNSTLQFLESDAFDPQITLDVYKSFSTSFNVLAHYETSIGIYNPKIDLSVSNLGSYPIDFFLDNHQFSRKDDVMSFINDTDLEADHTYRLYANASGQYLLYLAKNKNLPQTSISFALFNVERLLQTLIPTGNPLGFALTLTDAPLADTATFTAVSPILPIIYTASLPTTPVNPAIYKNIQWLMLGLLVPLLFALVYMLSRRYKTYKVLQSSQQHEHQLVLLKEVVYGIKNPNIKELLNKSAITLLDHTFFMLYITQKATTQDLKLSKTLLDETLCTTLTAETFKLLPISDTTAVVFIQTSTRSTLYDTLKVLRPTFADSYLILTDHLSLNEVSQKFYELHQLTQNASLLNKSNLILEEQIKIKLPVTYVFTEQDQKLLFYHLSIQNKTDYLGLVDSILVENLITRDLPNESYKQFINLMCDQLLQLSKELYTSETLLERLLSIVDKTQAKEELYTLFATYYNHLTQNTIKKDIQHRFLDYIHQNYMEDISLSDMATTFNLAVNYVGVLFKEKTGYNFKDYLNTYRIAMAKERLTLSPTIKIKDLSAEVGFVNINTFIRIFKKYEGISPGQYQKYLLDPTSLPQTSTEL